jgi:putative restriction endonuclease
MMTKAILTTKADPTYDDLPELRYNFPRTYLRTIEGAVGDWIIYYEPRRPSAELSSRGGRLSYFATARVTGVRPDPRKADSFYADISDYLEFPRPVPFKDGDRYYESGLKKADGGTSKGAFGRAARDISEIEYDMILKAGFMTDVLGERLNADDPPQGLAEEQATFDRPIIERVTNRPFRDAAFSSAIKVAYSNTCAFTGLKIINGGGRSEVQAAHIRPVADRGPDSVRNGLALCSTVHWMFDRGLLSLDDDYTILTATGKVPDMIQRLVNPDGKLLAPDRPEFRPHPQFLRYHRQFVFKG